MFDAETHSLGEFVSDPTRHLSRLRETKAPQTLTISGEPGIVVQDEESYDALIEELEGVRFVESLRQAHQNYREGKGVPIDEVEKTLRIKHGF